MIQISRMSFQRQQDFFDQAENTYRIVVIGAGSVGSFTVMSLAKMGVYNIEVWDDDKVEEHNLPNQFFGMDSLKKYKVDALKDMVKKFTDYNINTFSKKVDFRKIKIDSETILISAVDSMDVRKEIWKHVKKSRPRLYIDARMGGEVMKIYSIDFTNGTKPYEKTLHSASQSAKLPCTGRSIIYNILGISSLLANLVKRTVMGDKLPEEIIFDYNTLIFHKKD